MFSVRIRKIFLRDLDPHLRLYSNLRSTYRQHDEQADGGLHIVADGDDDDDDDDDDEL